MEMATRGQILGKPDDISHSTNSPVKDMNQIILSRAMGK